MYGGRIYSFPMPELGLFQAEVRFPPVVRSFPFAFAGKRCSPSGEMC